MMISACRPDGHDRAGLDSGIGRRGRPICPDGAVSPRRLFFRKKRRRSAPSRGSGWQGTAEVRTGEGRRNDAVSDRAPKRTDRCWVPPKAWIGSRMARGLLVYTKALLVCSWLRVPPLERRCDGVKLASDPPIPIEFRVGAVRCRPPTRRGGTAQRPIVPILGSMEAGHFRRGEHRGTGGGNMVLRMAEGAGRRSLPDGTGSATVIVTGGHNTKAIRMRRRVLQRSPRFCFRDPVPRRPTPPTVPSRRGGRAPWCKTWRKVRPTTLRRLAVVPIFGVRRRTQVSFL
jgi:hypothetical protein